MKPDGNHLWLHLLALLYHGYAPITHNPYNQYPAPCANAYFCRMNVQDDLQTRWWNLEAELVERFGKKPDMEAILFLIGIQEANKFDIKFTKEQKQDLMHVAICTLLMPSGYYELEAKDEEGWPHFKQLKALPEYGVQEQEVFLKDHILLYFDQQKHSTE